MLVLTDVVGEGVALGCVGVEAGVLVVAAPQATIKDRINTRNVHAKCC